MNIVTPAQFVQRRRAEIKKECDEILVNAYVDLDDFLDEPGGPADLEDMRERFYRFIFARYPERAPEEEVA